MAFVRGSSLYQVYSASFWTDAESQAVSRGGHLVTINDQLEDIWLAQNIYSEPNGDAFITHYYIGLTDRVAEGTFRWISSPLTAPSYLPQVFPTNGDNADYAVVGSNGDGVTFNWVIIDDAASYYRTSGGIFNSDIKAIAEFPISLTISTSPQPIEGAGLFTSSISVSAGSNSAGNLANGIPIFWTVSGITADDLSTGALSGTAVVVNGLVQIQHGLKVDSDTGEFFQISVFSDAGRTFQIGSTFSTAISEAPATPSPVPPAPPSEAPVTPSPVNPAPPTEAPAIPSQVSPAPPSSSSLFSRGTRTLLNLDLGKQDKVAFTPESLISGKPDIITSFSQSEDRFLLPRQFLGDKFGYFPVSKRSQLKKVKKGLNKSAIVYNKFSGELLYDSNGSAKGYGLGGVFAVLPDRPSIFASNIEIY